MNDDQDFKEIVTHGTTDAKALFSFYNHYIDIKNLSENELKDFLKEFRKKIVFDKIKDNFVNDDDIFKSIILNLDLINKKLGILEHD